MDEFCAEPMGQLPCVNLAVMSENHATFNAGFEPSRNPTLPTNDRIQVAIIAIST
jgi:hypothetical protein